MHQCSDSLGKAVVLSTLDANSGYLQVKNKVNDKDKPASTLRGGLYKYFRMFFELSDGPGTSQRTMDVMFSSV